MIQFKEIRPPEFDISVLRGPLFFEFGKFGKELLKEFEETTKNWKKRPKFEMRLETNLDGGKEEMRVVIFTKDVVWNSVDKGVPGRFIIAGSRVKDLPDGGWSIQTHVPGTYHRASLPDTISTGQRAGKVFDGKFINVTNGVNWTGIRPRNFTEKIRDKVSTSSNYDMQKRFQDVLNRHARETLK